MIAPDPAALRRAALPVLALVIPAVTIAAILAAAGSTLGYDYLAYDAAARRVLAGQPLYDLSYAAAGSFGLFFYPPTFIPLVLPFAALFDAHAATLAWIGTLLAAFGAPPELARQYMSASTGRDGEGAHPSPIVRPNADRTARPALSSAWRERARRIQGVGRFAARRIGSLCSWIRPRTARSVQLVMFRRDDATPIGTIARYDAGTLW
jgi:hypothetical protein